MTTALTLKRLKAHFVGLMDAEAPNPGPRGFLTKSAISNKYIRLHAKNCYNGCMRLAPSKISDFLLCECRERGELLTNLKLQKLLFYSDAWSLALFDDELFPETFQARVHGPVLVSEYHRFKDYRWEQISSDIEQPHFEDKITKHLLEIVEVFGSEPAVALELMTHREEPWIEARGGLPPDAPSNARISKETTKRFYRSMR